MRLSLTGIFLGICGEFSQMELMSREQCAMGEILKTFNDIESGQDEMSEHTWLYSDKTSCRTSVPNVI